MHVLGLPPAFVLSQDQTLKLKSCCQLNLDVRTSAHIDPAGMTGSYCLLCFWFHKKPETVQTVKLYLHDRPKPSRATYVQLFVHRMNQTAHISLQILSISKSVETKSTRSALSSWRNLRQLPLLFLPRFPLEHRSVVPSGVPLCASAPPVRGYLRIAADTRNPFFRETSSFFLFSSLSFIFNVLTSYLFRIYWHYPP